MTNKNESPQKTLQDAYKFVFSSRQGLTVLEDLCACLNRVSAPNNVDENMADRRAFEDGQRSVAIKILRMTRTDA